VQTIQNTEIQVQILPKDPHIHTHTHTITRQVKTSTVQDIPK